MRTPVVRSWELGMDIVTLGGGSRAAEHKDERNGACERRQSCTDGLNAGHGGPELGPRGNARNAFARELGRGRENVASSRMAGRGMKGKHAAARGIWCAG